MLKRGLYRASKALLDSSHRYEDTAHHLADHGITTGEVQFDLAKLLARKDKIVDQLTGGIDQLLKGNGVEWLKGRVNCLQVKKSSWFRTWKAKLKF